MFAAFSNDLPIKRKLYAAFSVIGLLAAAILLFALYEITSMGARFKSFEDLSGDALLASEMNADMAKLQLNSREFLSTRSDEDLAQIESFQQQFDELLSVARIEINNPARKERVSQIDGSIGSYNTGIDELVMLMRQRDEVVAKLDELGPQLRRDLTALIDQARAAGDFRTASAMSDAQEHFLLARLYVGKFLLNNDAADFQRILGEMDQAIGSLDSISASSIDRGALNDLRDAIPDYLFFAEQVNEVIQTRNNVRAEVLDLQGARINDLAAEIKESVNSDVATLAEEVLEIVSAMTWLTAAFGTVVVLIGTAIAVVLGTNISRPLSAMTDTMSRLADGDMSVDVSGVARKDEVGAMACAVQVFKDSMIRNAEMAEQQRLQQEKEQARANRIAELAAAFDGHSKDVIDRVRGGASTIIDTANTTTKGISESGSRSFEVAEAAERTNGSISTVASAAEQLAASIAEIADQMGRSSQVANSAVDQVEETNRMVQGLTQASEQIGNVVDLINDIAEQTNLLALNATIEAARAGEAGKGFAVVASEVKSLAQQTGQATQDISAQISSIQDATRGAVHAIDAIGSTIASINEIAAATAAAVEEQQAVTSEIASNTSVVSNDASVVSSNVQRLTRASSENSGRSIRMLWSADDLARVIEEFSGEIETFLKDVRAA